jgi:hypothetical protein
MTTTISGKGQMLSVPPAQAREPATRASVAKEADTDALPAASTDKVTLGGQIEFSETYASPLKKAPTSAADMQAILDESASKAQAVMDLILPLVQQQGLNLAKVVSGEQKLQVDQATVDKAKAAIADDGEFGVKQVAERILNFVKGVSGGDPAKLAAMRDAVEEGFKQATEMLGGKLPDISERTHTMIKETFDRWESEGAGSD